MTEYLNATQNVCFSMDVQRRNLLLAAMPAIVNPPPGAAECIQLTLSALLSLARLPPDPMVDIRHRLNEDAFNVWEGRDVFLQFSKHTYSFFQVTGETPDTLISVVRLIQARRQTEYEHKLSLRNRVLLFFLWLRTYPSYHMLALMFDVTVTTIKNEINSLIPMFHDVFASLVEWPSIREWRQMRFTWPRLPNCVGAIDGTSIEIYRPKVEPQRLYYSGHRHFHAIHAQVVVDCHGKIRYVECGFLGHQNDAQQFTLMRDIGYGKELNFPIDYYLLGDKIYPNRYPLLTPYTQPQIQRKERRMRLKCIQFNKALNEHRSSIERSIGELKRFRVLGTLWRHPRRKLKRVFDICAGLVIRRADLFY